MPRNLCQSSVRPKEADVQSLFQGQKFLGKALSNLIFSQTVLRLPSLGENCITSVHTASLQSKAKPLCAGPEKERELQEDNHLEYLYVIELWTILKSV